MIELTSDQRAALAAIRAWLRGGSKQVFRLEGFAGTGKTTLASILAAEVQRTYSLALTGKAASVLQSKGLPNCSTIHAAIYRLEEPAKGDAKPRFVFNRFSQIGEAGLVNEEIGSHLLSYGRPILAISDPFQLPPVEGAPFFAETPDAMLSEVV